MRLPLVLLSLLLASPVWANVRDFDGTGDYLDGVTAPTITDALTVCAWARTDTEKWERIVGAWGNLNAEQGFELGRQFAVTRVYQFEAENASGTGAIATCTTSPGSDNVWRFVCGQYDGTNLQCWVNGTSEDTTSLTGDIKTTTNINIGTTDDSADTDDWNGEIAFVQLYDRVLTSVEMQEQMFRPGSVPNSLLRFWPIWGVDDPETDLSGNADTLTVVNTTTTANGPAVMMGGAQ